MFTGLRKGDILALTRDAIRDGMIWRKTGKTGQQVSLPVHPDLAALLAAAPQHDSITICANLYGRPWTTSGFDTVFGRAMCRLEEAGMVGSGLTFHGLRHTVGGLLREITDDLDLIRRWLGQKTLHMAIPDSSRSLVRGFFSQGLIWYLRSFFCFAAFEGLGLLPGRCGSARMRLHRRFSNSRVRDLNRVRGELAERGGSSRRVLYSVGSGDPNHDAIIRINGEVPGDGPNLTNSSFRAVRSDRLRKQATKLSSRASEARKFLLSILARIRRMTH